MCKRNIPTQIVMNALDGNDSDLRLLANDYNLRDEHDIKRMLASLIFEVLNDEEYDNLTSDITDYFLSEVDFHALYAKYWNKG